LTILAIVVVAATTVIPSSWPSSSSSSSSTFRFLVNAQDAADADADADGDKVFCTVCSNGNVVVGSGSIGGRLCQDLDAEGRSDLYTREECNIIQSAASVAADDPCGCNDITVPPTPNPTVLRLTPLPTPVPTTKPTAEPTPRPTPCTL
jgi:hypothetical protein